MSHAELGGQIKEIIILHLNFSLRFKWGAVWAGSEEEPELTALDPARSCSRCTSPWSLQAANLVLDNVSSKLWLDFSALPFSLFIGFENLKATYLNKPLTHIQKKVLDMHVFTPFTIFLGEHMHALYSPCYEEMSDKRSKVVFS